MGSAESGKPFGPAAGWSSGQDASTATHLLWR